MKYWLSFAACFLANFSFAQSSKATFKLGPEYTIPETYVEKLYGNEKDGYFNFVFNGNAVNIVRIEPQTLLPTSGTSQKLSDLPKNFYSETVMEINSKCYWFHTNWDKSTERQTLYYDKIDMPSGKITAANQELIVSTSIGTANTLFYKEGYNQSKFSFYTNAAKSKLLVTYRLTPEKANDKVNYDKIGIQVFDENMNKLWGDIFTMPYTEVRMDNKSFSLDSAGNAYLLAMVFKGESRTGDDKSTGGPGYAYDILKFSKDSKEIIDTRISLDQHFIKFVKLIENPSHEMTVVCTYGSSSNYRSVTDGVYFAKLDAHGKLIKYHDGYVAFPLAEFQKFETEKTKRKLEKKGNLVAQPLEIQELIFEKDGAMFLTMEEHTMDHSIGYNFGYYNDIMAARINSGGQLDWLRKIPKSQGIGSPGPLSFKMLADTSGYYFLYLDNIKNLNLTEDQEAFYQWNDFGGQLTLARINKSGILTKEILFDKRDELLLVYPFFFNKAKDNQLIGRVKLKKKNTYRSLLITIN